MDRALSMKSFVLSLGFLFAIILMSWANCEKPHRSSQMTSLMKI